MTGEFQYPKVEGLEYKALEAHTADSKWQFCCCQTCQELRFKLDNMKGPKIDYAKYRHSDERY